MMKLAEALALRGEAQKRFEQLRARAVSSARFQEGEEPAEDASTLLAEAQDVLDELVALVAQINLTNSSNSLADGTTLTAALAKRDVLRLQHRLLNEVADAASGRGHRAPRQMRSELRQMAAVSVPELRGAADDVARQLRELDSRIQQRNWEIDLIE